MARPTKPTQKMLKAVKDSSEIDFVRAELDIVEGWLKQESLTKGGYFHAGGAINAARQRGAGEDVLKPYFDRLQKYEGVFGKPSRKRLWWA